MREGLRNVNAKHNLPLLLQIYQTQSESEQLDKLKVTAFLL